MSDDIDLVKQLRITAERYGGDFYTESIVDAAADEIERLQIENKELQEANEYLRRRVPLFVREEDLD